MTRHRFLAACVVLAALFVPCIARSQGSRHTLVASSERFELVIANDAIPPGAIAPLDVYVSDFETNAPVAGAVIEDETYTEDGYQDGARRDQDILDPLDEPQGVPRGVHPLPLGERL